MGIKPPKQLYNVIQRYVIDQVPEKEIVEVEVIKEKIVEVPGVQIQEKIVEVFRDKIVNHDTIQKVEVEVKNYKLAILAGIIAFILGLIGGFYGR